MSREDAELALQHRLNGTFLIRQSTNPNRRGELALSVKSVFTRASPCKRGISYGSVSARLSIASRYCIGKAERIELVFVKEAIPSAYPSPTLCWHIIRVPSKMRVLPSGILYQNLDLETACTSTAASADWRGHGFWVGVQRGGGQNGAFWCILRTVLLPRNAYAT